MSAQANLLGTALRRLKQGEETALLRGALGAVEAGIERADAKGMTLDLLRKELEASRVELERMIKRGD